MVTTFLKIVIKHAQLGLVQGNTLPVRDQKL